MNTTQINRHSLIEIAKNAGNLTNSAIINQLKGEGVKVKISHYRKKSKSGKSKRYMRHEKPFKPFSKGGHTEVILGFDDDFYYGRSLCHSGDSFSYKLGTRRALIQALHNLIQDLG